MENSNHGAGGESGYERLVGYNNMKLNGRDEFPCPFEACEQPCEAESPPPCPQWSVPTVTREGAVEALRRYASERGLDPRAAAEARVTHVEALHSFRYRLETFTERRVTRWTTEPFTGDSAEQINDPSELPQPWDIPVETPAFFRAASKDLPLPGTTVVKDCGRCQMRRNSKCYHCTSGQVSCYSCNGKGWTFNFTSRYNNTNYCYTCRGQGKVTCLYCGGDRGQRECPNCRGTRKIRLSITLQVMWMNYPDEVLCGQTDVPHAQHLPGQTLMTHTAERVGAVTEFEEPSLVQASRRLVREHLERHGDSCILQQRQCVELLSVTRVQYSWRGRSYVFYISGEDGSAIVEDYPQSSCQCCSLM